MIPESVKPYIHRLYREDEDTFQDVPERHFLLAKYLIDLIGEIESKHLLLKCFIVPKNHIVSSAKGEPIIAVCYEGRTEVADGIMYGLLDPQHTRLMFMQDRQGCYLESYNSWSACVYDIGKWDAQLG